jgi:hypothetical protein
MLVTAIIGQELSRTFQTFDALLDGGAARLRRLVEQYDEFFPPELEMIVAGWSGARDEPEAYVINTCDQTPDGIDPEQLDALRSSGKDIYLPEPFQFCRLPNAVTGPMLTGDIEARSGFGGIDVNDTPQNVIAALRFAIECQRHDIPPSIIPGGGTHFVGGLAQLTTVTPDEIAQRVLDRWPDKIGEAIQPGPIDWPKWRAERVSRKVAESVPDGLSRLQRERLMKKARKGTLRAVS